jgi:hypothetical protein
MSTIEVVKFRDVLRVGAATRLLPNVTTPTLELKGEDFSSADAVRINDMSVPSFIIVDKGTIWAELPATLVSIDSVSVISGDFTRTAEASIVDFKVGTSPRRISGVLKLSQLFLKWLLQSPDSDIFNPERGGGLQELVGVAYSTKNMNPILAALTRSVETTTSQILDAQLLRGQIPLDERLLETKLIELKVVDALMETRARIRVISMAGEEALSSVAL